jgi:N-acetylglucosamine kinase
VNAPVLCLDIGGSFIKSAISETAGAIDDIRQRPVPTGSWGDFSAAIGDIIAGYGDRLAAESPLALSCAGVVDVATDRILSSNVPPFQGVSVTRTLSAELRRPAVMANDADSFTLAEASGGAAQGFPVVLGIILGSGIGGGIAIHGNILYGNQGISAEWGHAPIVQTALKVGEHSLSLPRLPCGCGQTGCLDTLGGARGIERLHHILSGQALSSREIVAQGLAGREPQALTLAAWLEVVSEPLAHAVNILGPHRIVAGGGMASEAALISRLDEALRRKILLKTARPLIVAGRHASDGGLIGASILGQRLLSANSAPCLF